MKWYAGSDHAGLGLKRELVAALRELGDSVEDLGTMTDEQWRTAREAIQQSTQREKTQRAQGQ